jgi:hypothetical protein
MPWDQTDFMTLSKGDCPAFESALKNGVLHGMPYFPFCDISQAAASDDHVSQAFCNGNQFGLSETFVRNDPNVTVPATSLYVAPFGQVLLNLDPPTATNQNFKTVPCNPAPTQNQACVNGFVFNKNSSSTSVQRLTKTDGSFKYKLAVYHGGLVGPVASDVKCFSDMYAQFAKFVINRDIDIVLTSLQMPILPTTNKPGQFLYNLTPDAIIENFYSLLPNKTEVGMLTYINPHDSSWDFQSRDTTTSTPQSNYDAACTSYGIKTDSCFVNKYVADMIGGSSNEPSPWCTINDATSTPTCPNVAAQQAAYIATVNDAINAYKLNYPSYSGPEFVTYFGYDTEDAGGMLAYPNAKNTWNKINSGKQTFGLSMMPETVHAAKRRRTDSQGTSLQIGSAGGPSMVPSQNLDDFVMPEIYWQTNDLKPCTGSGPQYGTVPNAFDENNKPITFYGYPTICTTGTSYRQVGDQNLDGGDFFRFLQAINKAAGNSGMKSNTDAFGTMIKNFQANRGVWPMMSCENLSGCKDTRPKDAFSCLARAGLQGQGGSKLCGTFDGISYWTWDQVIQFFNAFYEAAFPESDPDPVGTPVFALYELQFIPPSWMCDSTDQTCTSTRAFDFTPPDTALMPNCKGGGGGGGGGGGDPCTVKAKDLLCDNNQTCIDFVNNNPSECGPYSGTCRTWDSHICQFHPNDPPPSMPCAPTTSLACTADTTCQDDLTKHPECSAYTGTCDTSNTCLFTPTTRSTCNPQPPMSCKTDNDCIPATCPGFNAVCRTDSSTPYCDFYKTNNAGDTCDPSPPSLPVMCGDGGSDDTPCSNYINANLTACKNYDPKAVYCNSNSGACHLPVRKDGQHADNQAFLSQVPHKRHDMQLSYASYSTTTF